MVLLSPDDQLGEFLENLLLCRNERRQIQIRIVSRNNKTTLSSFCVLQLTKELSIFASTLQVRSTAVVGKGPAASVDSRQTAGSRPAAAQRARMARSVSGRTKAIAGGFPGTLGRF